MALALEGIKVIDVSQVAAVPMAARHLADFGADVIHIEHPVRGDSWRNFQAGQGGTSGAPSRINYNWENFNRNKKSLALDLSQDSGREVIYRLLQQADVFVTNLRPFELKRYGLEYEILKQMNARLIFGCVNGWGLKGPGKDTPGYDATAYWAGAGICHRLQGPGADPSLFNWIPALGDNVAALALFSGVMTALYVRQKTGVGQEVAVSLFHTGVYQLSFDIAGALASGLDYDDWRINSNEDFPNALSAVYKTKDGRWLRLNILQTDRYWTKLCQALGRDDIEHDPRFETFQSRIDNHIALYHTLVDTFMTRNLEYWKSILSGIPFAAVQNFREVVNDPQARANGLFTPFEHPTYGHMEVVSSPINLSQTPASVRMPAPEFGQHTEEILLSNGYTWEDIGKLKELGIIA